VRYPAPIIWDDFQLKVLEWRETHNHLFDNLSNDDTQKLLNWNNCFIITLINIFSYKIDMKLRLKTIFKAFNDTIEFTFKFIIQTMYANL